MTSDMEPYVALPTAVSTDSRKKAATLPRALLTRAITSSTGESSSTFQMDLLAWRPTFFLGFLVTACMHLCSRESSLTLAPQKTTNEHNSFLNDFTRPLTESRGPTRISRGTGNRIGDFSCPIAKTKEPHY